MCHFESSIVDALNNPHDVVDEADHCKDYESKERKAEDAVCSNIGLFSMIFAEIVLLIVVAIDAEVEILQEK